MVDRARLSLFSGKNDILIPSIRAQVARAANGPHRSGGRRSPRVGGSATPSGILVALQRLGLQPS